MDQTDVENILNELLNAEIEVKAFLLTIILIILLIYRRKSKIVSRKQCPSCKTENAYRTKQNFSELYLFGLENYKKYKCINCARSFYIKNL
jgi:transposase-like protein